MSYNIYLLLGTMESYRGDSGVLLTNVLDIYSIPPDEVRVGWCYDQTPPSRKDDRWLLTEQARKRVFDEWTEAPFQIIVAFGWMACEVMLGVSSKDLSNYTGAEWRSGFPMFQEPFPYVWITYDPYAALRSPDLIVDISAVIVKACEEKGIPTLPDTLVKTFDWSPYL